MATVNITVDNDADFYQQFQYMTAAEFPVPIDITGGAMEMMFRRHVEDEAAYLRLGTDTGEITIDDGTQGKFSILILQDALERLTLGEYFHSLILSVGARKIKIWSGLFTVSAGATR